MIFRHRRRDSAWDLEAVEMGLRSAMLRAGARALGELLRQDPPPPQDRSRACGCGQQARYRELRAKTILTALGPVELCRPYYYCASCGQGQFPLDQELDVEGGELSPGVRRMLAVVGSETSFDHGREQMKLLADLEVTAKAVERTAEAVGADVAAREQKSIQQALQLPLPWAKDLEPSVPILYVQMDGTGVPMVKAETQGRAGRVAGQPAQTREAKLGCVFTQTTVDEEGRPVRQDGSTTYTGAIETAEEFGRRIFSEAHRRGWDRARIKVVMGDGAVWIWNLADLLFPGALQIVDLYHARQHLWELAGKLFPGDEAQRRRWAMRHQNYLDQGKIEKLVHALHACAQHLPTLTEEILTQAAYFETNAARMRYPEFRRQGLFIGSGVIEAGCKTVIGARLKQSGMFWTVRGANAILALRCCQHSGHFEEYWEARRA